MLSSVLLLVLAQGVAAPPSRPPLAPPAESVGGQYATVLVTSPQAPNAKNKFSATKILDVEFATQLRKRLRGRHVLNLKVYTPQGHLYQELSVPFDGGEATGVATDAAGSRRRMRLAARLPVGGTSISTASLYGKWKVVPYLDGDPKPCGPATVFSIVP